MQINCAIFDFDGTLFDSMYIWDELAITYLKTLHKVAKPSLLSDIQTMSLLESSQYLKNEYDLDLSVNEIMEGITKTMEDFYRFEIQPKAGVQDFLECLKQKHVHMCIATASDHTLVEAALKRCHLDGYFEAIFTCSEYGCNKNEPTLFREAMHFFNSTRNQTIVFEDALHAVQTAKKDHFMTVGVYDSSEPNSNQLKNISDCYLESFLETENFWKFVNF